MAFDDEQLEALLRRSDPARTPLDAPLTAAQLQIRDRITAEAIPHHTRHPLMWGGLVSAVAVVVAFVVVIVMMAPAPRATAGTPPPLTFTSSGETARDVIMEAQRALLTGDTVATASRFSQFTGWYAELSVNSEHEARANAIAPQVTTNDWAADQSGHRTVIAGHPYWADGSTDIVPAKAAPAPGTVIEDTRFTAGAFGAPTADPPGDTVAEMREWLAAFGLPDDADAADVIGTITTAMSYWTFTNAQHALLLQILLEHDDLQVLGTGKDRAGRSVVAVAADSARYAGIRKLLLIDQDTGRIVAQETMRTTPTGNLPAGSVIAYTLWGLPTP